MQAIRHVFVVNPAAGRENVAHDLTQRLQAMETDMQAELYVTKRPGDAVGYVRAMASADSAETRIYACGGDGTLHEVVNGAAGFPHVSVTAWPCGSGNDYVKYFGSAEWFLDLPALVRAPDRLVDLMQVNGSRYAINMVHFGLDSAVAEAMVRIRRWPLLGGKNAYYAGAIKAIITSVRNRGDVFVDGEQINDGELLLCNVACGQYVGGGFQSAPFSRNDDGILDVLLVKPMSRLRIPGLISLYRAGRHMGNPQLKDDLIYIKGTQVRGVMPENSTQLLDGEIVHIPDMTIRILPKHLRFAVPEGL